MEQERAVRGGAEELSTQVLPRDRFGLVRRSQIAVRSSGTVSVGCDQFSPRKSPALRQLTANAGTPGCGVSRSDYRADALVCRGSAPLWSAHRETIPAASLSHPTVTT